MKEKAFYLKVGDSFVRYQIVETENAEIKVAVDSNNHHVFFIDVSGSMWGEIDRLVTNLKKFVREVLKVGDTLTIYTFNHSFKLVLKHQMITTTDESFFAQFIDHVIDAEIYAGGLTGFAKPVNNMADENLVDFMKRLKDVPIKVYFMTDGWDNQSGGRQNILEAFSRIRPFIKVANTHVEGYGDYYDRQMLTAIAKHMNGIFVHVNNSDEYIDEVAVFAGNREKRAATKVKLADYGDFTFVLNSVDNSIIEIEQGKTEFDVNSEKFVVVTVSKLRPEDAKKVSTLDETGMQVALATAITASRNNQFDLGVEVLSDSVKDYHLADMLYNSQSQISFSKTEKVIQEAIGNDKLRFVEGVKKYLKDPNKIGQIEILEAIAADGNVMIELPRTYSSITFRPIKQTHHEDGTKYPKFEADDPNWVPFNTHSFTFNNESTNVSILFNQTGSVSINPAQAMKHNVPRTVKKVHQYKNYAVIGFLGDNRFKDEKGIPAIRIKNISKDLYDFLVTNKAIRSSTQFGNGVGRDGNGFRINLSRYGAIRRSRLTDVSSADYGKLEAEQRMIQVRNRIHNYFLGSEEVESKMEARFGDEEAAYLEEYALIDKNGNYKSKSIDLNHAIARAVLEAVKFDIDANLPEHTAKTKKGQKKTFEELKKPELQEMLLNAGIIDRVTYPVFGGSLKEVDGAAFNTVPSLTKIKEALLFKGDFVTDYLTEQKIPFTLPTTTTGKAKKLTQKDKKQLFDDAGIDLDLFGIEVILEGYAAKNGGAIDPKKFVADFGITNSMEAFLIEEFVKVYNTRLTNSDDANVKYHQGEVKTGKARLRGISVEKFEKKAAMLLGGKGYSDQKSRFETEAVTFDYEGRIFEYTPSNEDKTAYIGSLQHIIDRYSVDINAATPVGV